MSTEPLSSSTRTPDVDAARRSLLRGSLAAPVVMTVAPGAAIAQAKSSFSACLQDANEIPSTTKEAQIATDSFYRVPVVANKSVGDNNVYVFLGDDQKYYTIDYSTGDVAFVTSPPATTGSTKTFYVIKRYDDQLKKFTYPSLTGKENGWASFPACYNSVFALLP